MVEVTQSARDAAARIWRAQGNGFVADAIEWGEHDHWPVVQEVASAEHRGHIAGMREAAEIAEALAEKRLAQAQKRRVKGSANAGNIHQQGCGAKSAAQAIRQRATAIETGEG